MKPLWVNETTCVNDTLRELNSSQESELVNHGETIANTPAEYMAEKETETERINDVEKWPEVIVMNGPVATVCLGTKSHQSPRWQV